MRARALRLDEGMIERALGSVLAADARGVDGRIALRKGTLLGESHVDALAGLSGTELHLVDLDDDEIVQDQVAHRVARAIAGSGTRAEEARQGQSRVSATRRGVLRVRAETVRAINNLRTLLCFTLPDGQVVVEGDEVAGAKGATLATSEAVVRQAEAIAREAGGVIDVRAFAPRRVAVLLLDRLDPRGRDMVAATIGRKLDWYGCDLLGVTVVQPAPDSATRAIRQARAEGAELLFVSGAGSLDPLDPVFVAIADSGGKVDRVGVPAHPGSMVWLGSVGDAPVLGIATCSGFGKNTSLDVLLARVLSGDDPAEAAAELGVGGLLEGPSVVGRFPPYERSGDGRSMREDRPMTETADETAEDRTPEAEATSTA